MASKLCFWRVEVNAALTCLHGVFFFALSIAATAAFKLKNFIVGTGLPPPMTKGPTQSCDVLNEPFFVLGLIRV